MIEFDQNTGAVPDPRVSTGVSGLDDILVDGLMAHRLFLIEGQPGAGKTTSRGDGGPLLIARA